MITKEVFQPGNLVYGAPMSALPDILRTGIRPPAALGHDEETSPTPDDICFGMMGRFPQSERYLRAQHKGPKDLPLENPMVGIIISRPGLLDRFKGCLRAVGAAFRDRTAALYEFSGDGNHVYEIPVRPIPDTNTNGSFSDQVRLYAHDLSHTFVPPEIWDALVINPADTEKLEDVMNQSGVELNIPVVSPNGEIIKAPFE